jgi:hypothetical protein
MHDAWSHQIESWHEFFMLIGTAGLTLTGLLFVVISLGPHIIARNEGVGVKAFVSPNAVFFTTTLVVSAVFLVPELSATAIGAFLCGGAAASLGYLAYTRAHHHWRTHNLPAMDWIWYIGMPHASYLLLLAGGAGIASGIALSFHAVGLALMLLLVIGIHNAWDLVIWIAQQEHKETQKEQKK